jgi:hypothetical protein
MVPRLRFSGFREFKHPRQAELSELLTLEGRLSEVAQALGALETTLGKMSPVGSGLNREPYDSLSVRSLYCFAVVTYIRCFTTGRRQTLEIANVPRIGKRQLELHRRIRAVRNQHLAHAVVWEEAAHVYLRVAEDDNKPYAFHVIQAVLASDGPEEIRKFRALVARVRAHVLTRVAAIGNEVARDIFGPKAKWSELANKSQNAKRDS